MSPLRYLKENMFTPPYRLLPLAVFALFALSFMCHPLSPVRTTELFDTDDYMRLNEVINWLQGQGWYDLSQPRLGPGEHVIIHWSRLVDIPLALIALLFIPLFGMQNAALIASFIVPPALFALMLTLAPMLARMPAGKRRANSATILLLFMFGVLLNYMPGRADHHGYEILIGAFGLVALERILLCRGGWKAAITAAILFACGLWISPEILPWIVCFLGGLALLGGWRGGYALRNAAIFGLGFPPAVAAVIPLALRPADYTSMALSWFSGAYFIFALLGGGVLILGWLAGRHAARPWLRTALSAALGFFAAMLFLALMPGILVTPYADYDAFFNATLLGNISEARPFLSVLHVNIHDPSSLPRAAALFLRTAWLPLLGLLVVIWNLFRARGHARLIWIMHGLFLLPAFLLTMFWQLRVLAFAEIYSLAPLAWLMWRWRDRIAAGLAGRARFRAGLASFFLIAPLPAVLLPALLTPMPFFPDTVLFPAARDARSCSAKTAGEYLASAYSDRPHVILSGTNEGPELLFRTQHQVLAAPYDVKSNRDVFDFFNARESEPSLDVIRRRNVDLVLVCRHISLFYAGLGSREARLRADIYNDKEGHMRLISDRDRPTLIEKLVNGAPVVWLKPIVIPFDKDYLLFEVVYPRDRPPCGRC